MENNCEIKPRPKTIKEFFNSWFFWKPLIAMSIGGLTGFLYYHYVGCASGQCAISSNPYLSILWGALLGYFIVSSPCARGKC